jgi:riboflavin kinase/FMN adenylyltransferase
MRVLGSIDALAEISSPVVLAAGVFDGMHLGHRAVLETALAESRRLGAVAVALTFDPHPASILRPDAVPRLLTPTPRKLRLMEELGFETALVVDFNADFAAMSAEDFVTNLASAAHPLSGICIGEGWMFGHRRQGNVALLRRIGSEKNFFTREVPPVLVDGILVSSTLVRQSIAEGRLSQAERLLGRPHALVGTVLRGAGLGRKIGFPTANISIDQQQLPPDGVYAVEVVLDHKTFPAVANLGIRPTVSSDPRRLLEVHLFDFSGDLYGSELEVRFLDFLRPEKKFESLDALRESIARDATAAREFLATAHTAA